MRDTPSAFGISQTELGAAVLARLDAGIAPGLAGVGNEFGLEGARNASGGSDGACIWVGEIGRGDIVPVTSSGSGLRTVNSRPSVKLIPPTASAATPAVAKRPILRI